MKAIEMGYGNSKVKFEFEQSHFDIIGSEKNTEPLTDNEIGRKLDAPFDSKSLEEIVRPGETVLIAVPDATRKVGTGQIVNILIRRLIAAGTMPYDIGIIFSTGLHRHLTDKERNEILTPFIAQRVKSYDHNPGDLMEILNLGQTSAGIPIELNRRAVETDHLIIVGGITFHYFAGFTGGRKLVCPGLASKRTITGSHSLAFDNENAQRANGVGPGLLDGNPVHEAFEEIVERVPPSFAINTFVDKQGAITNLVCGNWKASHREACRIYSEEHVWTISEKRGLVIVSCGGAPYDINMVQAHKAIEMASRACSEGGTILVLAECSDGAGSPEFEKAFQFRDSSELADNLAAGYKVGGQTAWSLRKKAERFEIKIVTLLPEDLTRKMGLRKYNGFDEALAASKSFTHGYIMPYGAKFMPRAQ